LRNEIQEFIRSRSLTEKVILCGAKIQDSVVQYLHGADTFVLSSVSEGMPMCVLETLGCGLPVVSTEVGEARRVVLHGENGEVLSQYDADSFSTARQIHQLGPSRNISVLGKCRRTTISVCYVQFLQ